MLNMESPDDELPVEVPPALDESDDDDETDDKIVDDDEVTDESVK